MHDIVRFWRQCDFSTPPYVHKADRDFVEASERPKPINLEDHAAFVAHECFGDRGDSSLHLSLLPVPYQGNLLTADIFIVLLNPGLGLSDYQVNADNRHSEQLIKILRQELVDVPYPFLSLNPEFAWTGGFAWWEKKLAPIIRSIVKKQNMGYAEAMRNLSQRLAAIEVFPYHSRNFDADKLRAKLPSVQQAKKFIHELLPRALAGQICIVVSRGIKILEIDDHDLVNYDPKQVRGASFGLETTAGRSIVKFLERRPLQSR